MISYFINFYSNLGTSDLILFWLVILLFFLLLVLTITLSVKNKELIKIINMQSQSKEKKEVVPEENTPFLSNSIEETELKEEVTIPVQKEIVNSKLEEVPVKEEKVIEPLQGPYQRNVLREIERRNQTSPINIIKKQDDIISIKDLSKNIDDEILDNDYLDKEYEELDASNISFVEEISKKMEEEIKPQTIELTDYEKKQEEEAIISYQELLQTKDKIYNITDDEDIDDFIDNLRDFRASLE